ncbi:lipase 3-like [Teleopsis dalmanni]|uniref:lipase 3-like n=1 Tax=Teleopsis dalmanni TaxID=139649 RepID=UPI0018CD59A6|nr:lipase 3-like [Teleopsis dalmanni]XP_037954037.1 lipase 3-like [Teleopsis dalmanni]
MFRQLLIFLPLIAVTLAASLGYDPYIDLPHLKPVKTSAERIEEHGYPAESHFVETKDGYVLNMFRIPYSPKLNNKDKPKPVVFIMHGQFSCSDCYLLNGPDNALAYNFADENYDVWLGNARGNIYCRNNTKISLNHPKFWEFSWHEIGNIDVPTMIDYILDLTGESKIHYVGHSQGTTVFFVMTSTRPEYNDKIKTAHMMAPPIFMGNCTDDLVVLLSPYVGTPGVGANLLGNQQFVPSNPFIQRILDTACGGDPTFPEYCQTLFLLWAGTEQVNLNVTLLPQVAETHPAGISTNQGIHYIQESVSNHFRQFDHGPKKNLKRYGQEVPPDYNLQNIVVDMYIYYGLADTSANAKDIQRLPEHLSNIKHFYEVPNPTWGHLDFIFANQVKEEMNDKIINFCNKYEQVEANL